MLKSLITKRHFATSRKIDAQFITSGLYVPGN